MRPNAHSHPRQEGTPGRSDVQLPVVVSERPRLPGFGEGKAEGITEPHVGAGSRGRGGQDTGGLRPPDPVRGKGRVGLQLTPQQQLLNNHFPRVCKSSVGGAVCVIPAMLSADGPQAMPPARDDSREHEARWLPAPLPSSERSEQHPGGRHTRLQAPGSFLGVSVAVSQADGSMSPAVGRTNRASPKHQLPSAPFMPRIRAQSRLRPRKREQGRPITDLIAHKHRPEEAEQKAGPAERSPRSSRPLPGLLGSKS